MAYSLRDLGWLLRRLEEEGVRGVVIGSTVVDLALGRKSFEDDVDIFALEPSPLIEEDTYRGIAERNGWEMSYTALGTPKLVARVPSGEEVVVEVYENVFDFYIPQGMLEDTVSEKLPGGAEARLLRPEYYAVLKAKAARAPDIEDLRILREYVEEGKLRLDEERIRKGLEMLPEEDRKLAVDKLRELGFRV